MVAVQYVLTSLFVLKNYLKNYQLQTKALQLMIFFSFSTRDELAYEPYNRREKSMAPSKTAPAAGNDSAQPPSLKKGLSSKQKECVRQVKGLFTLTGPINLNVFFPAFVIGEIIFKEGLNELDPCLFKYLQELLPYRHALISACALLLLALVGIICGFILLRSAMACFDAGG